MVIYKTSDGNITGDSRSSKSVTLSEYNKATITYEKEYEVTVTEDAKEQITDTDVKGKTIILGTRVVKKPKLDKDGKAKTTKEVREVTYNPYEGYVIIPDDATILTEEEYNKELEELQSKSQEIFESTNNEQKK